MEENDDKKPLQFNILGLPSNDEIEIEEEEKQPYRRQPKLPKDVEEAFNNIFGSDQSKKLDELKEMAEKITPQEKAMMEQMFKAMGIDVNAMLKNFGGDEFENDEDTESEEESEGEDPTVFELGKIEHLFQKEAFQQILIQESPDLYINFIEEFGPAPYTMALFSKKGIPCYSSCPAPLTKIDQLSIIDHNNKYILLYGTTNDKAEQGLFVAVAKGESGKFQLIIPEYGNTYDLVNPDDNWDDSEMFEANPKNCKFFSIDKNPELFTEEGKFKFLDLEKLHAGLDWLLCQKEEPLVSPNKFGELIQVRSSVDVQSDVMALRIGILKSNESSAATLLKRDFDVPEDKLTFDFYLKFPTSIPGIVANHIADYLNQVDIRSSALLDNKELKVLGRGDKLYINFDLDRIGSNLGKWINPRGNSEL